MHTSVLNWIDTALSEQDIEGRTVLEVGSYNVNGTARPLIERHSPSWYLGVDATAGPGVDEVVDCGSLTDTFGAGAWDVVLSTEMLEHVRDWRQCVRNLIEVVAPDGLLVITTRSPGFPYHPFPEDHWRYTLTAIRQIVERAGLEVLVAVTDPQDPGVFVKAHKPASWVWPKRDPWTGIDVVPVHMRQIKEITVSGTKNDKMVAALLRERVALEQQGKADRVAQVDEQLIHFGYEGDEGKAKARKQPPQGRTAKPQQTTAEDDK